MPWAHSVAIVIDHTKVPSTQTNFPMVFAGGYAELAGTGFGGAVTSAAGYDIIFASDSLGASPLNFERVAYRNRTGACEFWVNIPSLSSSANTTIYILYGNSAITTDQQNATAVWDANYVGVWHCANAAGVMASDSTSNANNGTLPTPPTFTAALSPFNGPGAATVNGSNYITLPTFTPALFTVEAWIYPTSSGHIGGYFAGNPNALELRQQGSNHLEMLKESTASMGVSTGTLTMSAWNHAVINYNSPAMSFYIAGAAAGTASNAQTFTSTGYYIGAAGNSEFFIGSIVEVRLSNSIRSADWITTSYNNQNSPSTFYSVSLTPVASPWAISFLWTLCGSPSPSIRGAYFTVWAPSPYIAPSPNLPPHPAPVGAVLGGGTVGVAYSETITSVPGQPPITYVVTSGSLPAGLSLASGGVISGTPTTVGTSSFTVTATDANSMTGVQTFQITIAAAGGGGATNYGFVG